MDRVSQNSRNFFHQKTPTKTQCSALSTVVVKFFPKLMQSILTDYIKPKGLNAKFRNNDLKVSFTTDDLLLMSKLPKIEDFTISLCYKILRYENLIEEPTCKWGNIPDDNHVKMSDDVLRILHIVNEIITKPDITNDYYLETKQKIESIIRRVDSNLDSDNNQCQELYTSICDSSDDVSTGLNILKTLPIVQVSTMSLDTNKNQMRERCARLSVLVFDILPEILRFIIKSKISAVEMYTKCIRILYKFSGIQQANLRLMHCTNTYDSLDIVVLCKLLRTFCHKLGIQPPAQGWGTKPHPADQNTGDDIERISILRNKLAHTCNADICEAKYDDFIGQIESISSRIDQTYGTRFKHRISECQTKYMDINMQQNYQKAIRELENVQFRHENEPVKFYWGDTFETNLRNIRAMLKNATEEGRQTIRLKVVLTYEKDQHEAVRILNEMTEDINRGLSGIEFTMASPGSIELHVEISIGLVVTDEELLTHVYSLINNILQLGVLDILSNESVDVYLIFEEEYSESTIVFDKEETNDTSEIILEFDVKADVFETEDTMKEKLGNAVKNVMQHANGNVENTKISATILPLEIEQDGRISTNRPVSKYPGDKNSEFLQKSGQYDTKMSICAASKVQFSLNKKHETIIGISDFEEQDIEEDNDCNKGRNGERRVVEIEPNVNSSNGHEMENKKQTCNLQAENIKDMTSTKTYQNLQESIEKEKVRRKFYMEDGDEYCFTIPTSDKCVEIEPNSSIKTERENNVVVSNEDYLDAVDSFDCTNHCEEKDDDNPVCLDCIKQTKVLSMYDIKRGDHIAFTGGNYYHHAIVVYIDARTDKKVDLEIVHGTNFAPSRIMKVKISVNLKDTNIVVFKYSSNIQQFSTDDIVKRAKSEANTDSIVGKFKHDFCRNNCKHFASWCVTGRKLNLKERSLTKVILMFLRHACKGISDENKINEKEYELGMICSVCYEKNKAVLNVEKRNIRKYKDVNIGDIIMYSYYNSWHNAVVLNVEGKNDNNMTCDIAHYAYCGLFKNRTIIKEKLLIPFDGSVKVLIYPASTFNIYSPQEIVSRAERRINEQEFDYLLNNSNQYARWCIFL